MKAQFLKIAGAKSEKEFYSKYPTPEDFFNAFPHARKMQMGGKVTPINVATSMPDMIGSPDGDQYVYSAKDMSYIIESLTEKGYTWDEIDSVLKGKRDFYMEGDKPQRPSLGKMPVASASYVSPTELDINMQMRSAPAEDTRRFDFSSAKTFSEAFRQARKELGPGATFRYKGKVYGTNLKGEATSKSYATPPRTSDLVDVYPRMQRGGNYPASPTADEYFNFGYPFDHMHYFYQDGGECIECEEMKKGGWIQKATASIKRRGTEGVCSGDKFGGPSCPPGSKRYNLAKTFRKMAKKREEGGETLYTTDEVIDEKNNYFMTALQDNMNDHIFDSINKEGLPEAQVGLTMDGKTQYGPWSSEYADKSTSTPGSVNNYYMNPMTGGYGYPQWAPWQGGSYYSGFPINAGPMYSRTWGNMGQVDWSKIDPNNMSGSSFGMTLPFGFGFGRTKFDFTGQGSKNQKQNQGSPSTPKDYSGQSLLDGNTAPMVTPNIGPMSTYGSNRINMPYGSGIQQSDIDNHRFFPKMKNWFKNTFTHPQMQTGGDASQWYFNFNPNQFIYDNNRLASVLENAQAYEQEQRDMAKKNADQMFDFHTFNDQGSYGQTGSYSGIFRPGEKVPVQFGLGMPNSNLKCGGGHYQVGGEYDLTEAEIAEIKRNGGEVEFI